MPKKKSSLMAYFINTGTVGSPVWASLGKGVVSLPVSYNPQVTTETYVNEDNATTSIDSYQAQIGLAVTVWDDSNAPAHAYIETFRKARAVGSRAETQILEIDLSTTSPYVAQVSDAVLSVDTFTVEGGKPQAMENTIYLNGDPYNGTAVITNGAPVFTSGTAAAISFTSVPATGASAVARSSSIVLTFNNAIRAEAISIATAAGVIVPFAKSWSASKKVITLTPSSTMAATTLHIVTVAGIADIYGQTLAASTVTFTTGS